LRGIAILEEGKHYVAELHDDRAADWAVDLFSGQTIDGHTFSITYFDIDSSAHSHLAPFTESPAKFSSGDPFKSSINAPPGLGLPLLSSSSSSSDVFGSTTLAVNHQRKHRPVTDTKDYGTLCSDQIPEHLRINLTSIELGMEHRCTAMFRSKSLRWQLARLTERSQTSRTT
jgi:hypothetical protein